MKSNKVTARIAGLLYLAVIIFGMYAELYVRNLFIIPDDAPTTVKNILAHTATFRIGFLSDLLMQISYFFLAFTLYQLFKKVHKGHALLMVLSVVMSVAIMSLNMLHQYTAITILEKSGLSNAFEAEQTYELATLFLDLHRNGYRIAQIFFGLWLLPLGYLACQSGWVPKWIGILLMVSCFCFLIDFFLYFLMPNYSASLSSWITLPTSISEFSLCLWLIFKGIKEH